MPDRRLPRANAFAARGDPDRSWSGVSMRDGAVVLAMRTVDVHVNGESAGVDPDESVSLRVIRICGEYWAKWGSATRPRVAECSAFATGYMQEARLAALPG
jgi:hypothetical protein